MSAFWKMVSAVIVATVLSSCGDEAQVRNLEAELAHQKKLAAAEWEAVNQQRIASHFDLDRLNLSRERASLEIESLRQSMAAEIETERQAVENETQSIAALQLEFEKHRKFVEQGDKARRARNEGMLDWKCGNNGVFELDQSIKKRKRGINVAERVIDHLESLAAQAATIQIGRKEETRP